MYLEESSQGPPRKYYQITERGRILLVAMNRCWGGIRQGIDALIAGSALSQQHQTAYPKESPQCQSKQR
jgi:DNA-binding PadR family transcriptional regulator